ncbi:unnamed protein product [Parascedosporium putredinis]|uniref:DNA-directed DNA polymerase n=1 Tax=Parascedosporium putredinis TaxID=1442378 RepID=A0A9P1H3W1_9PEZI|nr:unnamed protein product [Parascedosporium putredinis]CAI7997641.1 unnamed protein product [Parascedosporium putredinis]
MGSESGSQAILEKHKYFHQLDSILGRRAYDADVSSDEDEDDAFDEEEEALRRKCRGFLKDAHAPTRRIATPLNSSQSSLSASQTRPGVPPKRVVSAPLPTTIAIEATPVSEHPRKRAGEAAVIDLTASFVEETPERDYALVTQEDGRCYSPQLGKRLALYILGHEEASNLLRLALFYIPDNDVAPLRRARITKAREHGAAWTRDMAEATHIVVDKHLKFADIAATLETRPTSEDAALVNDEFPLDCISFKHLLNPRQLKYRVAGDPSGVATGEKPEDSTSPGKTTVARKQRDSPPLRHPHANAKIWTHLPNFGTQSQDSGPPPPLEDPGSGAQLDPTRDHIVISDDSQPVPPKEDLVGDELSGYINMMQQYRALPLDDELEDEGGEDDAATTIVASDDDNPGKGSSSEEEELRRKTRRTTSAAAAKRVKKSLKFEERFACNQGGTRDKADECPNARTVEVLQEMCTYYTRMNDTWRTLGYRKAIKTLQRQDSKIRTAEEARLLPNIGDRLALKIEEIVTTDRLQRLEYAHAEPLDAVLQLFLNIYGVGLSQANQWIAQGFRTLDDLRDKAKLTPNQRIGVEALGDFVKSAARRLDPAVELIVGGSYRRGAESSHDIDFIVTKAGTRTTTDLAPFLAKLLARLEADGFIVATLAASRTRTDPSKWHGCCVLPMASPDPQIANPDQATAATTATRNSPIWRRIDFLLVPETEMGAALIYFTGNDIFNRSMRLLASRKGMRLNQRGLYEGVMRGPAARSSQRERWSRAGAKRESLRF